MKRKKDDSYFMWGSRKIHLVLAKRSLIEFMVECQMHAWADNSTRVFNTPAYLGYFCKTKNSRFNHFSAVHLIDVIVCGNSLSESLSVIEISYKKQQVEK